MDNGAKVALAAGLGLVGYGLYEYIKRGGGGGGPVPEDHMFQDLMIASGIQTVMAESQVTIKGSFQHKGPSGTMRVIVDIGHVPFASLTGDSGYKNYAVSKSADWKSYSWTVTVDLTGATGSIHSPWDVKARVWDVAGARTVAEKTRTGIINVTTKISRINYSVSPSGSGYFTRGGTYGSEVGTIESGENYDWIEVQVVERPGWAFDHWEGTAELMHAANINPNLVKNIDCTLKAVFVQSSAKAHWIFSTVNAGSNCLTVISIKVNGVEKYNWTVGDHPDIFFDIGDEVVLECYDAWNQTGTVFDHWALDGNNIGNGNPVLFRITDAVSHTIKAVRRRI
ncbi:hypothetical protein [Halothiobacillus sp.]|jgi:hypothetical protein|uniref:hypothetical protein n=1 Tax=Halothiobacillus sp. TaxID=1891311 RepID=UPI002636D847|nr:hypothetical protein [Halothiobacillus sp.]MDD4967304.1 hypothetical protein [Halothiobacillus sp.]